MADCKLTEISLRRMNGVNARLVSVVELAVKLSPVCFQVSEGVRTHQRQKALVKAGASRTLQSRHLTGHAVDLFAVVDGVARWDWPLYHRIAAAMKQAAAAIGVEIVWGGDWRRFPDGPHFEMKL